MARNFESQAVLVTGGGSGLGQACVKAFAEQGARVAVADISTDAAETVASAIRSSGGDAFAITCDVRDAAQVDAMVAAVTRAWGAIDIAVNSAGVLAAVANTAEAEESDFDRVMGINAKGTWLCMRAELQSMLPNGKGSIINMGSALSLHSRAGASPYVTSKHAVAGMTKTAALEYAQSGIRINAVCPGIIQTPLIEQATDDPKLKAGMSSAHPMGRLGSPAEVAGAVLWLASDEASFVTGTLLSVDGGWNAT